MTARITDMARTLKIELAVPNALSVPGLVSEFQNFGEEVYRALRDECVISPDEIDQFSGAFHLRGIHRRDFRTIAARVRGILEKYAALNDVTISGTSDGSAGHAMDARTG